MLTLADDQAPTKQLNLSPTSISQRRKYDEISWVEVKSGKDHLLINITGKTDSAWRNYLNLPTISNMGIVRNKKESKTSHTSIILGSTALTTVLPPLSKWQREMENEGCSQFLMLLVCCFFLLPFFSYYSMGTVPSDTVFHDFLQHGSFP